MVKCIAPGCSSGYQSNPEKVHFFSVPKDENLLKLWQKAILRKDFIVKSSQSVCEKHFHNEDIFYEKILKTPDGTILGRSPYKCARLRKGALPSLFSGCPSYLSKTTTTRKSLKKRSLGIEITDKSSINIKKKCKIDEKIDVTNDFPQHNPEFIFATLLQSDISFPTSWSKQNISSNFGDFLQFTEWCQN